MKYFITLLVLSVLPLTSFAEEVKVKGKENVQKRRAEDVSQYDANKDGVLQPEELQEGWVSRFKEIDTNEDGNLTLDERNAFIEKFAEEKRSIYGKNAERRAQRLKKLYRLADENDGDKNGQVTWQEYKAAMDRRQKYFDQNKDGTVAVEEYRADEEKLWGLYKRPPKEKN